MPNNKEHTQSGLPNSTGIKPEAEAHGTESKETHDATSTAGGREGDFSDKSRGEKEQWSPGAKQPADR